MRPGLGADVFGAFSTVSTGKINRKPPVQPENKCLGNAAGADCICEQLVPFSPEPLLRKEASPLVLGRREFRKTSREGHFCFLCQSRGLHETLVISSGAWRGAPDGVATLEVRKGAFDAFNKGSGALGKWSKVVAPSKAPLEELYDDSPVKSF